MTPLSRYDLCHGPAAPNPDCVHGQRSLPELAGDDREEGTVGNDLRPR